MRSMRGGFTMIELIFVIVIIGILTAIAVPKLAATRDDAVIVKARETVGSVRSSLSTERQKSILRGQFSAVSDLGDATYAFSYFDGNTSRPVLEYPIKNCSSGKRGCWHRDSATKYTFRGPGGVDTVFKLQNNRFNCISNCKNFE